MNEHIHGFTRLRQVPMPELEGQLFEFVHDQTGLKLAWLSRKDDNKTFGIAFTTLPEDNTGVFHILEHSVLCGSDRYPVKEPFVELMKSSMNTFLNAMTFPDKTFYPISSRNDKDFLNLMRVYLDAVFHPAVYHKPEIFRQEGWSYEFDENGTPGYKGVVFNEMKGALADPDEQAQVALTRALFPDTPYAFVSGGDPAYIPDLSYEKFVESHRRFYAPSNAFVFLDGDLDLDTVLGILDGEFLKDFGRTQRIAPPALQAPVDGGVQEIAYEISPEESPEGKVRLAQGWVIGTWADREALTALRILAEVLAGTNHSPLKKAILSAGLAEDLSISVIDGVSQPYLLLSVRNLRQEDVDTVRQLIRRELERLCTEGFDQMQLESELARAEFLERERDYGSYPKGIVLGMSALETWLYGGNPETNLQIGNLYAGLREKVSTGWFEALLKDLLLENPHRAQVILLPSAQAGEERRQKELSRLAAEAAAWTPQQREFHIQQQAQLLSWQNSEDSPEALATLPHLDLKDLDQKPEALPTEVCQIDGLTVLKHAIAANGIVYVTLYFDADCYQPQELSALGFLAGLLGKLGTTDTPAELLNSRIGLLLGCLDSYLTATTQQATGKTAAKLCVSFSTLESNLQPALELVFEILTKTDFSEEAEIRSLLRQQIELERDQLVMAGHSAALKRVAAQFSKDGAINEYAGGFEAYLWMKAQEEAGQALSPLLSSLYRRAFRRTGLTVSVTGSQCFAETIAAAFAALPQGTAEAPAKISAFGTQKEGVVIPADICFAVRGGNIGAYSGDLALCAKIVSLAYLWNTIRVTGGAYGTGMLIRPNGALYCYSYRDPNGSRSLEKYLSCGEALRSFCQECDDLTGFIIGTVSDASPVLTPRMIGMNADSYYWRGITYEDRCRYRQELLSATPEKLIAAADRIDSVLQPSGFCVLGGPELVAQCHPDSTRNV